MLRNAIILAGLLIASAATLGGGQEAFAQGLEPTPVALAQLFDAEEPGETTELSSKWSRVLNATQGGREPCPTEAPDCRAWADLRAALSSEHDDVALAARVNAAVNERTYRADNRLWGSSDYWATPAEFLSRGGDCEDFAIAKYFLLRELGIPDEAMRIAVVRNVAKREMHAVLVVRTSSGAFVLDNLAADLVPVQGAPQYETLFAVNQASIWVYIPLTRSSTAAGG
jgi:predicted transglutaminase-like cysteine proteinase